MWTDKLPRTGLGGGGKEGEGGNRKLLYLYNVVFLTPLSKHVWARGKPVYEIYIFLYTRILIITISIFPVGFYDRPGQRAFLPGIRLGARQLYIIIEHVPTTAPNAVRSVQIFLRAIKSF